MSGLGTALICLDFTCWVANSAHGHSSGHMRICMGLVDATSRNGYAKSRCNAMDSPTPLRCTVLQHGVSTAHQLISRGAVLLKHGLQSEQHNRLIIANIFRKVPHAPPCCGGKPVCCVTTETPVSHICRNNIMR
jgi:hypothetical protein